MRHPPPTSTLFPYTTLFRSRSAGPLLGIDVRNAVLHGGEEFALLFTASLRESELSARVGRPVYAIGRIVKERSEEHTSELQSHHDLVCRLLLEKKKQTPLIT